MRFSARNRLKSLLVLLAGSLLLRLSEAAGVRSTVLVIADSDATANEATSTLRGYGLTYQVAVAASQDAALPQLTDSQTDGRFGAIIVMGDMLGTAQLDQLHNYQTSFGVRLAWVNASPGANSGTTAAGGGCCDAGVEQLLSITDSSQFGTAGLKTNAGMSTLDLFHTPAIISDTATTKEIAQFAPAGAFSNPTTAAVIQSTQNREQMVWFVPVNTNFSPTSNLVMHACIHWMTRGLYLGYRRVNLNTQIDDMFLMTGLFNPTGVNFRMRPEDLQAHKDWTPQINGKMPSGSSYFVEIGHNGNGNIETAQTGSNGAATCTPGSITYTRVSPATDTEFQKPLGTGEDIWPAQPAEFPWSTACLDLDPLKQWVTNTDNLNAFGHISHTFTHMSLNNATYADASREIRFNQAWLTTSGIAAASKFSASGLIPPAITGLRNGDALKAFRDAGLTNAVGDNTRMTLLNKENELWPLISTTAENGFDGFTIMPRWATNVYFNCDTISCNHAQWQSLTQNTGNVQEFWRQERQANVRHLFALRRDPFMFHQANLRHADIQDWDTGLGVSGKVSLLQAWVELVVGEVTRLVDWPIITLKHDDLAATFLARQARDRCGPSLILNYSTGRQRSIVSVSVSTASPCREPIPVTVPGDVSNAGSARREKVGSDPLTLWVDMAGGQGPVTLDLSAPITV